MLHPRDRRAIFLVVCAALALVGCGETRDAVGTQPTRQVVIDGDHMVYGTAAALTSAATIVVRGTVGTLRETEVDDGGDSSGTGFPMAYFNFSVAELLAGPPTESNIVVAWLDKSVDTSDLSALTTGDQVILFAEYVTSASAPGMYSESAVYVPLAGDNGVLDVISNNVVARSPDLTSLEGIPQGKAADTSEGDLLDVPLEDLREVVSRYA